MNKRRENQRVFFWVPAGGRAAAVGAVLQRRVGAVALEDVVLPLVPASIRSGPFKGQFQIIQGAMFALLAARRVAYPINTLWLLLLLQQ